MFGIVVGVLPIVVPSPLVGGGSSAGGHGALGFASADEFLSAELAETDPSP